GVNTFVGMSATRWGRRAEDGGVQGQLLSRARSGDDVAFEELVGPYHRELQAHCYRILGSAVDAEDAFQESLTAAWKGLAGFEGRASFRTWLYRIATGRCLNMVRARRRSPASATLMDVEPPELSRLGEVLWLEPYPDAILAEVADPAAGPEARYVQRETISLAFIAALQLLPPRQRAALILTDVVWLRMPPNPLEYHGKERAKRWFATTAFREGLRFRLVPTRANGQPAFGLYVFSPLSRVAHAFGLIVVTLVGGRVSAITAFESGV